MLYQWLLVLKNQVINYGLALRAGHCSPSFCAFAPFRARTLEVASLPDIKQETLESLLNVIASSMLAVTTFSLSIMVAAFASASNGATPRATDLVMGTVPHALRLPVLFALLFTPLLPKRR